MGTTIYYFSGTGNSLKIAKELNAQLEDSKIIQISNKNLSITKDVLSDRIGIIFPIYFNGLLPWLRIF